MNDRLMERQSTQDLPVGNWQDQTKWTPNGHHGIVFHLFVKILYTCVLQWE